jgi:hypothetical protein
MDWIRQTYGNPTLNLWVTKNRELADLTNKYQLFKRTLRLVVTC